MAKLRRLVDVVTREPYYQDQATGMEFRRVVGGLAWPCAGKHGCLVVLAEARNRHNALGIRHHVHILEEARMKNGLTNNIARMTEGALVSYWATATSDNRSWMIDDLNDDLHRLRKPSIRFGDPQEWQGKGEGLMPFYHTLVQRRTVDEKTLFFGEGSTCADEIAKLTEDDMTKKPTDFPGAAALFFALAEIDVNPISAWGFKRASSLVGPADEIGGY